MAELSETVALVLSEDAGSFLRELASRVPVWVVGSPANVSLAQSIWSQPHAAAQRTPSVTTFVPGVPFEPLSRATSLVDTIEEHHPRLRHLEVFGVELSPNARAAFTAVGFNAFSPVAGGFSASRTGP